MNEISVITPFHFFNHERGDIKSATKRLSSSLMSITHHSTLSIVIATNQSELTIKNKNINIVVDTQQCPIYSAGVSRNKCATHINSRFIFFMDADLLSSPELEQSIKNRTTNHFHKSKNIFEMYPCLYLTKEETERFDGDFQGCLESFLRGENHRVEGIALASSCLLMNREWFLQLGGFDEQFVGHGGEDLELIDRLTRHYPIGPRPDDYALNIKAQHPGDYQGFRRYFSYYALPHLFAGRFLVHQWHPRPLTHPYHKRRASNDQLLEQMLARSEAERGPLKGPAVPCNDLGGELPDFREWMIRLQEEAGYPVSEYPGLLRWQEGVQRKRPLWRKLRKLYLNPRAFFADMR